MFLVKTPTFIKRIYPSLHWDFADAMKKEVYLTFDDGPIPELTPWVLEVLEKYNVKATFFCVGENVVSHPEIYKSILERGHAVGNHTYNHYNGREHSHDDYLKNIAKCAEVMDTNLFRPPYGRMRYSQMVALRAKYNVIMWDVLTWDFDKNTSPEKCLENALQKTKNGSIVVFHDNLKAANNLKYALPRYIKQMLAEGYHFKIIPQMDIN